MVAGVGCFEDGHPHTFYVSFFGTKERGREKHARDRESSQEKEPGNFQ